MNMNELYAARSEKRAELKAVRIKIEKHEQAIERLKKKESKLWDDVSWVNLLVYPLAETLKKYTCADSYKVYGPFGLRADTSIYLYKESTGLTGGITLTIDGNDRLHYDTGEKKGGYEVGSIGQLNGFDNVTAPLPDEISEIASLLHWFKSEL